MKHNFKYRYTPRKTFNKPTDWGTIPDPSQIKNKAMILHKDIYCTEVNENRVDWILIDEKGNGVCTVHGKDENEASVIADYLCNSTDLDSASFEKSFLYRPENVQFEITRHPEDIQSIIEAIEEDTIEFLPFHLVAKLLAKGFIQFA